MKKQVWWYELKDKASELASELDNPASVMIRRLISEIEKLEEMNKAWSTRHWELVEENTALKEKLKQWEEDLPDLSEAECSCGFEEYDDHSCPYQCDVNGDEEFTCRCCPVCEQNCADDI